MPKMSVLSTCAKKIYGGKVHLPVGYLSLGVTGKIFLI